MFIKPELIPNKAKLKYKLKQCYFNATSLSSSSIIPNNRQSKANQKGLKQLLSTDKSVYSENQMASGSGKYTSIQHIKMRATVNNDW